MIDEDYVDEFLEHFGVKGMKWGVRKENSKIFAPGKKKSPRLTKKEKKQLTVAALKTVGGAAALMGTYYAIHFIGDHGIETVSKLRSNRASKDFIDVGSRVAKTIFENRMIASAPLMLTR